MKNEILRIENVSLSGGPGISFSLFEHEFLMIMGLRGNHYNQLADIISGYRLPEAGHIRIEKKNHVFRSPQEAAAQNIYDLSTSTNLINNFTLAENIFLIPGRNSSPPFIRRFRNRRLAASLFLRLGLSLSPDSYGRDCGIFEKHAVETARLVNEGAKVIIFRNVISLYTKDELLKFQKLVHALLHQGISVILFSGIISDICADADRLLIMRNATIAHMFEKNRFSPEELFRAFTQNKEIPDSFAPAHQPQSRVFLELRHFLPDGFGGEPLSISLHSEEVLALITPDNLDARRLADSLYGENTFSGSMLLDGVEAAPKSSDQAITAGIALIHDDEDYSLFYNMSAELNSTIGLGKKLGLFAGVSDRHLDSFVFNEAAKAYGIDPYVYKNKRVKERSAINKLKLSTLRWLVARSRIIVYVFPYKRLDEVDRLEFNRFLLTVVSKGTSCILITSQANDAERVADTVAYLNSAPGTVSGGSGKA